MGPYPYLYLSLSLPLSFAVSSFLFSADSCTTNEFYISVLRMVLREATAVGSAGTPPVDLCRLMSRGIDCEREGPAGLVLLPPCVALFGGVVGRAELRALGLSPTPLRLTLLDRTLPLPSPPTPPFPPPRLPVPLPPLPARPVPREKESLRTTRPLPPCLPLAPLDDDDDEDEEADEEDRGGLDDWGEFEAPLIIGRAVGRLESLV